MKKIIHTDNAPDAIGTYSQAVVTDNLIFISGQIPLDPKSMEIVSGDFKDRTHRVFKNLKNIANAAGGNLDDAVKVTIFLTDLDNFAAVNEVMAEYFQKPYPARAAVGVSALPKGVDVEIEAILGITG
jgi:reactive intermediate/imine deaminase